jgi:UDP-N-acetyl-D-galactosamine dehydrogenase
MAHHRKVSVVGLGYVGLPVAITFGKVERVVGFDISRQRIEELRQGHDRTGEVADHDLAAAKVYFTNFPEDLRAADFHIIAVPTPVDTAKQPDFKPLLRASEVVGKQLKQGDVVVYESTVYPGATEEICIPMLEQSSGLRCGTDFTVGYSPERINPGDKEHSFTRITKVVSAQDQATLEIVAAVYESAVQAGIYKAASIKVAEAAKVIENTQRDLNIALMNELALIFNRLGIDTLDVLAAAGTKWNFLPFSPGLVGGHCIGVDPYYLTHKSAMVGYYPQVILAGRRINDGMGEFIAGEMVKNLIRQGRSVKGSVVTVLGFTFKENVPDLRNSRVIDIIRELQDYGIAVQVHDPMADREEAQAEYGVTLQDPAELKPAQGVVLAVAHREFVQRGWGLVLELLEEAAGVVVDVKGILPRRNVPQDVLLWRL